MINTQHTAIRNTHPSVVTVNDDTNAFDNDGNAVALDQTLITTEVIRLQAEYDAQAYARSRKVKYDLLNQFELIGDDATNGTTTHKDAIAAIKAAHPKP